MIGNCLENVRKNVPLVHNITNYVTVNDVANVLLACGGSPIMSDEPDDVADITSICGGLNINIGTLNKNSIEGMFIAGKKANELSHKILLDPVGAVFKTGSKDDADDVSHDELQKICEAVDIPVIAIGGISSKNVTELKGRGIVGIAVISAIFAQPDITKATAELKALTEKTVAND